ncbi:UDP-N-acetylglucosamine 2-epimerase [soil metagenome]
MKSPACRRVCFVTGTRAEFGLMDSTLRAIAAHPRLKLQLVVTGMHLDRRRGDSKKQINDLGWTINRIVPWPSDQVARSTGQALAHLSDAFDELRSEVVLVVGDRVEAFAAASAAHISGRIVAHVHGGDRALGQVDDALRHAITKLAHIHFPATQASAKRIVKLGEDHWRVHQVGSPGIDGIKQAIDQQATVAAQRAARLTRRQYALLVLHPIDAHEAVEFRRAKMVLRSILKSGIERVAIVYPNNDPGGNGIIRAWKAYSDDRVATYPNVARGVFLGLMRDAAVMVGNSSSGIIEAASFGTPVVDIGPRQLGRERGRNVVNAPYSPAEIVRAIQSALRGPRVSIRNVYAGPEDNRRTSQRIAAILSSVRIHQRLRRKLIAY